MIATIVTKQVMLSLCPFFSFFCNEDVWLQCLQRASAMSSGSVQICPRVFSTLVRRVVSPGRRRRSLALYPRTLMGQLGKSIPPPLSGGLFTDEEGLKAQLCRGLQKTNRQILQTNYNKQSTHIVHKTQFPEARSQTRKAWKALPRDPF